MSDSLAAEGYWGYLRRVMGATRWLVGALTCAHVGNGGSGTLANFPKAVDQDMRTLLNRLTYISWSGGKSQAFNMSRIF